MTTDFAPESPDFYLGDPYPVLRRLRREDPVHWHEKAACWCLTKHADIELVSRSPQLFTSTRGIQLGFGPDARGQEGEEPDGFGRSRFVRGDFL